MSSYLCFICHNTVHDDTTKETREKYRELVGMQLCPDSNLCHICCHLLNKLCLFKSICLRRSLEYPVLFSDKGTINMQNSNIETTIICTHIDECYPNKNTNSFHFSRNEECVNSNISNQYVSLEDKLYENMHTLRNFNVGEVNHEKFDNLNDSHVDIDVNNEINKFEENQTENEHIDEETITNVDNDEETITNVDNDEETITNVDNDEETITNVDNDEETITNVDNDEETANIDNDKDTANDESAGLNEKNDFHRVILSVEEQRAELEARRREDKYLEAEFKCYNCALGFLFKDTYQAHMMRHEESNGEHLCPICTLRFASSAVLRAHAASHRERVWCARCGRAVRPRRTRAHRARCAPRAAAPCHLCGNTFSDASGLQQHIKRFHHSKTSNKTYSCNVCGKSYNNQGAVRTHMIKHINKKFTCDLCPSTFSSPYTMAQHRKKHSAVEEHRCETCNLSYKSRKSLLAHIRNSLSHQQTVFTCPVCQRVCAHRRALAAHAAAHGAQRPHACALCPARYATRKSLAAHERAHARAAPRAAVCHLCGKSFKGNSKLNRHLRSVCEKEKLEEELSAYYQQE